MFKIRKMSLHDKELEQIYCWNIFVLLSQNHTEDNEWQVRIPKRRCDLHNIHAIATSSHLKSCSWVQQQPLSPPTWSQVMPAQGTARTSYTCQGHATPKANISPYGNYSPVCCQVFKEKPDANCSPQDLAAARSLGCQRMQHTRPLPSSHPLSLHRCSGKQDKQPNYWVVEAALGRRGPLSLSSEKV